MSYEVRTAYGSDKYVKVYHSDMEVVIAKCKPTTVVVWLCLLRRADNEDGRCFPSLSTIAEEANVSERTVTAAVKELQSIGALTYERRKKEDNSNTSNLYTLYRLGATADSAVPTESFVPPLGTKLDTPPWYQNLPNNYTHSTELDTGELDLYAQTEVDVDWWFDQFYERYPRVGKRAVARKSWGKLPKNPELYEEIIHRMEVHKQTTWKHRENQYIPYASTFLNQRLWEDEPEPPSSPSRGRHEGMSGDEILAYGQELEERLKEMFR